MKKISIIIATYNAGQVLQRCLDSIRPQKTDEIELLIIDGNSKDNTMLIVNDNNDIIDYSISEPDKGIYDAWNKGIKAATGEWVEFLGADDMLLSDSLKFYLDYLAKNSDIKKYDVIFGKCWLVNEAGVKLVRMGEPYNWKQFKRYMNVSHGSGLHNRLLFDKIGYFSLDFRICADYEFLLRKKLNCKFVDKEILEMQTGGMSNSIAGLIDSYKVKQYRKSSPKIVNLFYLIKGVMGFYYKKMLKGF